MSTTTTGHHCRLRCFGPSTGKATRDKQQQSIAIGTGTGLIRRRQCRAFLPPAYLPAAAGGVPSPCGPTRRLLPAAATGWGRVSRLLFAPVDADECLPPLPAPFLFALFPGGRDTTSSTIIMMYDTVAASNGSEGMSDLGGDWASSRRANGSDYGHSFPLWLIDRPPAAALLSSLPIAAAAVKCCPNK